jgi:hypothetical protein
MDRERSVSIILEQYGRRFLYTCIIVLMCIPTAYLSRRKQGYFRFFFLFPTSKVADGEMPDPQGYLCCKRRVLEFEEFLKIEGCTEGLHRFVPKSKGDVRET